MKVRVLQTSYLGLILNFVISISYSSLYFGTAVNVGPDMLSDTFYCDRYSIRNY